MDSSRYGRGSTTALATAYGRPRHRPDPPRSSPTERVSRFTRGRSPRCPSGCFAEASPRQQRAVRRRRAAGCGYQDSAFHLMPVVMRLPLILSLPRNEPIKVAESVPKGMSLAMGLPRLVITMPSGSFCSRRARHCSLNLAAGLSRVTN